jgi:hypothetical protein
VRLGSLALLAGIVLSGCQEKLTSPADCPALCPGGSPQVFDEVITPIIGADSNFRGYVKSFAAAALLVSNGLNGIEERAIMRFPSRSDSVSVRDTLRAYTIDSVAFGFTVLARDTLTTGLQVHLYRLPVSIDSTTTFADVDPALVPENLVTSIGVPDSMKAGAIRTVLQGADLSRVQIPAGDSGVLALGVRLEAPTSTGLRLGAAGSGTSGVFITYATLAIPDTGTAKLRTLSLTSTFNSSVASTPQVDDPDLLAVGGEPSARALLRFELPARLRDSATIVRATLELTPVVPIAGLPTDPARLQARPVLADIGAKSPVASSIALIVGGRLQAFPLPADTLEVGATTVSLEAGRLVELWLGATTRPSALVLTLPPDLEAASFTRPVFYSTRAPEPVRPRLRISYLLSFPFENP